MSDNNQTSKNPNNTVDQAASEFGITITHSGSGRNILLLHGGGGPMTISSFAQQLSQYYHVITPIHPGFAKTNRLPNITTVKDIAGVYSKFIEQCGYDDVIVIGSSMGGWIGSEIAASHTKGVVGLIILNGIGIEVPGEEVLDVFTIPSSELANYSFHNPDKYRIDMSKLSDDQKASMKANFDSLAMYGGKEMKDKTLKDRLSSVIIPVLVVWGESDRVVKPNYGRQYAAAYKNSKFELIPEAGHLPSTEQPERLLELIKQFDKDCRK